MSSYRQNAPDRLARLLIMLEQSQDLIRGLGQYVPNEDPNRQIMIEVMANNAVVIAHESKAQMDESQAPSIITL